MHNLPWQAINGGFSLEHSRHDAAIKTRPQGLMWGRDLTRSNLDVCPAGHYEPNSFIVTDICPWSATIAFFSNITVCIRINLYENLTIFENTLETNLTFPIFLPGLREMIFSSIQCISEFRLLKIMKQNRNKFCVLESLYS